MEYSISELGKMAGISTRTLRHYDQIGLLKPIRKSSSGYRIYGENEVNLLQQILFFRELEIPLSEIQKLISSSDYSRKSTLQSHLLKLMERRQEVELLIENVKKSLSEEEGKITMSNKEKFEGFKKQIIDENEQKYGQEIRERYGDDTVNKSNAKMMGLTQEKYDEFNALAAEINKSLEECVKKGIEPASEKGLKIAGMHKKWLDFSWDQYSKEAHANLAEMCITDNRFKSYYDSKVEGCAQFLKDAITAFLAL